jgi:phenylacetate-CoA ligase
MILDLASRPLNAGAYSDQPFTFLDHACQNDLANIEAINLIENGDRAAREDWQNRRLTYLLRHAQTRSNFWRKRLPSRRINHEAMKYVPIQSRADVATQATLEGSLMTAPGNAPVSSYASTGSTGTPVKVYACPENAYYNLVRSLAQYFINGLSLDEERVLVIPAISLAKVEEKTLAVEASDSWAGPLSKVFRNGSSRKIIHQFDDDALIEELSKRPFGYLVCANRYMEILIKKAGIDFVKNLGIKLWIHLNDFRDPEIVEALKQVGIGSLSNYSAGEIGPIAFECARHQGHFHVAHSNVLVECDHRLTASFNGASLGRLLVTHLHSYATPIIRYDIGDFGQLEPRCPCGHDGPTISNIFGRGKHFLRHPDGRLLPFYLSTRTLMEIMEFKEMRVRQDKVDTISVEIGGMESIPADVEQQLRKYIIRATDPGFNIEIKPVLQIDWSTNPKRLFFASSVA